MIWDYQKIELNNSELFGLYVSGDIIIILVSDDKYTEFYKHTPYVFNRNPDITSDDVKTRYHSKFNSIAKLLSRKKLDITTFKDLENEKLVEINRYHMKMR